MAKKQPQPEPTRAQKEEFIRAVAGEPIPLAHYNPDSLNRLYSYARGVLQRGEQFDLRRGTGHPPKIQHHDYETKPMQNLPPHKQEVFRIPMLDDWYIGTCERPAILSDVTRLLKHADNASAQFLYLAFVGKVRFPDGHEEEEKAYPVNVSRIDLQAAMKTVTNLPDLFDLLYKKVPKSFEWLKICQISMRPAIERGTLMVPPSPTKKKKPRVKLIEPGGPGKKPKYRLL